MMFPRRLKKTERDVNFFSKIVLQCELFDSVSTIQCWHMNFHVCLNVIIVTAEDRLLGMRMVTLFIGGVNLACSWVWYFISAVEFYYINGSCTDVHNCTNAYAPKSATFIFITVIL